MPTYIESFRRLVEEWDIGRWSEFVIYIIHKRKIKRYRKCDYRTLYELALEFIERKK